MKKYIIAAVFFLAAQSHSMQVVGHTTHKVNLVGGLHIQKRNTSAFSKIHYFDNSKLQNKLSQTKYIIEDYSENTSKLESLLSKKSADKDDKKILLGDEALRSLYNNAIHIHKLLPIQTRKYSKNVGNNELFMHFPQKSANLYLEFYNNEIFLKSPAGSIYLGDHYSLKGEFLKTVTEHLVSFFPKFIDQGYYWKLSEDFKGRYYQDRIGYGLKLTRIPVNHQNFLKLTDPKIQATLADIQELSNMDTINAYNIFLKNVRHYKNGRENLKVIQEILNKYSESYNLRVEEMKFSEYNLHFSNPERIKSFADKLNIIPENWKYLIGLE